MDDGINRKLRSEVNRLIDESSAIKYAHEHQFTIPVEWIEAEEPTTPKHGIYAFQTVYRTTKLRCACGEETSR